MIVRHLKPWRSMPWRSFSSSATDQGSSDARSRTFSSCGGAVSRLYRLRTEESERPVLSCCAMTVQRGPYCSTQLRMAESSTVVQGAVVQGAVVQGAVVQGEVQGELQREY